MRRHICRTRRKYFKSANWRTRFIFWGGAILIGAVSASFALISEYADHFFRTMTADRVWLPFIITPLSLVTIAWLTRKVFAGAEGSGLPQTLIALAGSGGKLSNQLLSVRIAIGKFLLTTLAMFAGASVGRVGPTVHIGAAIMHSIGQRMHITSRYLERALILTGCGAGIAAAFNTPLAGIMFAIEEMAKSFDRRNITMMMIGIVLAGMAAISIHQGNYNYYGTTPVDIDFSWVWVGVLVCGVVGGVLGGIFSQFLITASRLLRPVMLNHWFYVAFMCGLVVALVGYLSGGTTYGTGYIEAKNIVSCAGSANCDVEVGFMYPFYKIIATTASYLSGIPGGIFVPTLASGAGLGYDISAYFPEAMVSTIVVLGMVGYFSGVVQTPITTFIIVMEMTDNQDLVLAMMATSLLASGTSKLICKKSIYMALAENFMAARTLNRRSHQHDDDLNKT